MGLLFPSVDDIAAVRVGSVGRFVFYRNGDFSVLGHRFTQKDLLVEFTLGKYVLNKVTGYEQELHISDEGVVYRLSYMNGGWKHHNDTVSEERRVAKPPAARNGQRVTV
ncbi:MAG: hypothetical protein U0795_23485 [Pirellulales bacterium]